MVKKKNNNNMADFLSHYVTEFDKVLKVFTDSLAKRYLFRTKRLGSSRLCLSQNVVLSVLKAAFCKTCFRFSIVRKQSDFQLKCFNEKSLESVWYQIDSVA